MELPLGTAKTPELVGGVSPNESTLGAIQPELLSTSSDTPKKIHQEDSKKSILATLLAHSSRHLFGPTSAPSKPLKHQVVSIEGLLSKLTYLKPDEVVQVKKAFQFADTAHLGQYRHSGEPYITHPVAVAELCATWR